MFIIILLILVGLSDCYVLGHCHGLKNGTNVTTVDYYEKLISASIAAAENYTLDTNAYRYIGNYYQTLNAKDFGVYDFIVIGAGAAGAVLATRLSENKIWKILLLEAGVYETDFIDISGLNTYNRYTDYNWGFVSTPQTGACLGMVDRECPFPRGRAIGGTTVINGLLYSRGHAKDFDRWSNQVGGGYSYKEVLPYFRKAENQTIYADPYYHGTEGPLTVSYPVPLSPQAQAFLDANVELGGKIVEYNGEEEFGFSRVELNTKFGRRASTGNSYVMPNKDRKNFVVLTNSFVTRVLIRQGKAYGVEFVRDGVRSVATVSKEVLVCGGTVGSPAILIHSGIGPKEELNNLTIDLVKDLPVGKGMYDHPTFYGLTFSSNYTEPNATLRQQIEQFLTGEGRLTIPGNYQALGFFESKNNNRTGTPDLEIFMSASGTSNPLVQSLYRLRDDVYDAIWGNGNSSTNFDIALILLHARSTGEIRVVSNNPFDYPQIDPRFLTDEENLDIDTMYEGVQHVLRLLDTNAFKQLNVSLVNYTFPACNTTKYMSKAYWYCTLRQFTMNIYHPSSTCRMGFEKDGGVVDREMKVHGVKALRVCDASVIPFPLSGHPSAPITMLGEKLADMLKKQYNKGWDGIKNGFDVIKNALDNMKNNLDGIKNG